MKIKNEVKIGAVTLMALVLGYIGFNYLKGVNLFNAKSEYYVRFSELGGLSEASPVTISGFKVGAVRKVHFGYDQGAGFSAVLTLSLSPDVQIPRDGRLIVKTNLLSGAEIVLERDSTLRGEGYYSPGDTIASSETRDLMTIASKELLPEVVSLLPQLTGTITRLNEIVSNRAIDTMLMNLQQTTAEVQRMTSRLNASMARMPQVMHNVEQMSQSMATIGRNAESVRLDSIVANLNTTTANLQALTDQLRSTDGTAGKLLNDPSLYNSLDSLTNSADRLLRDLKANPKRYVHFSLF